MATIEEPRKNDDRYVQYLDERISQTAMQVKWVEFFSVCLFLTIGVLSILFGLCLIDAWVYPLSPWMRWTAFIILAGGTIGFLVKSVIPFFLLRVNPLYAAQKIEEGRPELKNSVINYLTTEENPDSRTAQAVRQKLSQAAANQVSQIPSDSTVDRSVMIVGGYVLAAVAALFAIYKIVSPKDPFQTIGRIALPSADLMAPARVKISAIQPGEAQVYFGDSLIVSAKVSGLRSDELVTLRYTTDDGRQNDYPVPMTRTGESNDFSVTLGAETGGLQQSFRYRITAGDASTVSYPVEVRTSPTIFIERLEFEPPKYTGLPERVVQSPDEIKDIEGTTVKIFVRTNLPIQQAYLDVYRPRVTEEAAAEKSAEVDQNPKPAKTILLTSDGTDQASGELVLQLDNKRQFSRYGSAHVRFVTTEGDESRNPNRIDLMTVADLAPEIEIDTPLEKETEVPLDQVASITGYAVDPDFGLTSIQLYLSRKGMALPIQRLFRAKPSKDDVVGDRGQRPFQFEFRPGDFGLKPGDQVIWFVEAKDNRSVGPNEVLDPNRTRTDDYQFKIIEPLDPEYQPKDSNDQTESQESQKGPENQPKEDDRNSDDESKDSESKGSESKGSESKGSESKGSESKGSESKGSESKAGGEPEKNSTNPKENQPKSEPNQNSKESSGGSGKESGSNSGKNSDSKKGSSGKGESGDKADPIEDRNSQNSQSDSSSGDNREGAKSNSTESENGKTENGTRKKGDAGTDDQNNDSLDSNNSGESSEGKARNSKEAFDRLKEMLDQDRKKQEENGGKQDPQKGSDPKRPEQKPDGQKGSTDGKEDPAGSDREKTKGSNNNSAKNDSPNSEKTDGDNSKQNSETGPKKGSNDGPEDQKKSEQKGSKTKPGTQKSDDSKPAAKQGPDGNAEEKNAEGKNTDSANDKTGNSKRNPDDPQSKSSDNNQNDAGKKSGEQTKSEKGEPEKGEPEKGEKGETQGKQKTDPESKNQKGDANQEGPKTNSGGSTGEVNRSDPNRPEKTNQQNSNATGEEGNLDPDKKDLDYAKKTTDLILEKLKDQKDNPDPELLEKLQWSKEELQEFTERWEAMRRNAEKGDARQERAYKNALKSLGLTDPSNKSVRQNLSDDDRTGYRQKGRTRDVPAEFADQFRAIQKSQRTMKRPAGKSSEK